MSRAVTTVQSRNDAWRETFPLPVNDPRTPLHHIDEVKRFLLDVPKADLDLIEQYAEFANAAAEADGKKLKRRWSRKSMAEQFLADQTNVLRQQLAEMWAEVGPFPVFDPEDTAANRTAMEKYAKRAVDWAKGKTKPKK